MVPLAPAAQMLLASLPQTADRFCVVPLTCAVQVLPFHFRMLRGKQGSYVDGVLIHPAPSAAAGSVCGGSQAALVGPRGTWTYSRRAGSVGERVPRRGPVPFRGAPSPLSVHAADSVPKA